MFKGKTKILIVILLILIFILILIQLFLNNDQKESRQQEKSDPVIFDTSGPPFYVVRSTAGLQKIGVTDPIQVTFSQPLAIDGFEYEITPNVDVTLILDSTGKILTITPKTTWDFATSYTFKIHDETVDQNGQKLNDDAIIYFSTGPYTGI